MPKIVLKNNDSLREFPNGEIKWMSGGIWQFNC